MKGRATISFGGRVRQVTVRYRAWLPRLFRGGGITLTANTVRLKRGPGEVPSILMAHEFVHIEQAMRYGWCYLPRYLWQAIRYGWRGKRKIPMEREAYDRQGAIVLGKDRIIVLEYAP